MIFEIIEVESYSGYKKDERPLAFNFRGKHRQVESIIDRWYEGGVKAGSPVYNYFKVKTSSDEVFLLRYNVRLESWAILIV